MDSVTHVFLGAAVTQAFFGKRLGRAAFWLGGLAATMPDFDIFLYTGDSIRDHLLHRHFMHSLVFVPLLAALAVVPFLFLKRLRPVGPVMLVAAMAACATHVFLDTLTSYGTMVFWPFTQRRYALDVIAAFDPVYTVVLMIGVFWAMKRGSGRAAQIALAVSFLYLGFAVLQHHRAELAQEYLIAGRHQEGAENPRVIPQLGAVVNYRSVYVFEGKIYADGIRVVPFAGARVKRGGAVEQVRIGGLKVSARVAEAGHAENFLAFADGFAARVPGKEGVIGDMRYAVSPEGFEPFWGIELEGAGAPRWWSFIPWDAGRRIWRELVRPEGYVRVGD